MKLRLGGKAAAQPSRIRRGFRLADIDRPRERQWNVLEHPAPGPALRRQRGAGSDAAALEDPERRMRDLLALPPLPAGIVPEIAAIVATVADELQEVGVGHAVRVDL